MLAICAFRALSDMVLIQCRYFASGFDPSEPSACCSATAGRLLFTLNHAKRLERYGNLTPYDFWLRVFHLAYLAPGVAQMPSNAVHGTCSELRQLGAAFKGLCSSPGASPDQKQLLTQVFD